MDKLMKKSGMKGLMLVLIIALVLTPLISFGDSPTETKKTSHYQVGPTYVDVDGDGDISYDGYTDPEQTVTGGAAGELYAKYSKSITGTAIEDEFDITLKVQTNEKISDIYQPSNIMIVLDISNSMDTEKVDIDGDGDKDIERWKVFRDAMSKFITEFLADDVNSISGENQVCIGVFGGARNSTYKTTPHAIITNGWVKTTAAALNTFNKASARDMRVEYLKDTTSGDHNYGFTNGQAAFKTALDGVKLPSKPDQYTSVIVVSDGEFNRNLDSTSGDTGVANTKALAESAKIKAYDKDIDLYTFAISAQGKQSSAMIAGTGTGQNPNVDKTFYASDNNISSILGNLYKEIQSKVQCWTVTDPMSKWVDYDTLISGNSKVITVTDDAITWDLQNDKTYTTKTIPGENGQKDSYEYTYTMTYRVKLDRDVVKAADAWGDYVPTNKQTTLSYAFVKNNVLGETEYTDFRIPTVKANPPIVYKDVSITKNVKGIKDNSKEFKFEVIKAGELYKNGEYYVNGSKKTADDKGIIKLTGGQTAVIKDVAVDTNITVRELVDPGYTVNNETQSITVSKDGSNSISFTNTYIQPTSLSAIKDSDPEPGSRVWRGDTIDYTINVINEDSITATGIVVKDYIPEFTALNDAGNGTEGSDSKGTYVAWYIEELAPGEKSEDLHFTVIVTDDFVLGEEIVNIAKYDATGITDGAVDFDDVALDKETNEVKHYPPLPTMDIKKANKPGEGEYVSGGDPIEYTISVTNNGKVPLSRVWVRDYVPAETTLVEDSGTYTSDHNFTTGTNNNQKYVQWFIEDSIAVGDTVELVFTVKLNAKYTDGLVVRNVALCEIVEEAPGDGDPEHPTNEVTNPTTKVEPEQAKEEPTPPQGTVLGDEEKPDEEPAVLGDEAKTADTTELSPSFMVMIIAAVAVMLVALWRMSRKED